MISKYICGLLLITTTALRILKNPANKNSFMHIQDLQNQPYTCIIEEYMVVWGYHVTSSRSHSKGGTDLGINQGKPIIPCPSWLAFFPIPMLESDDCTAL